MATIIKPLKKQSISNKSHTLAYSLVALQEMNLAFKYPIMFWNCACLISDAGGNGTEEIDEQIVEEIKEEPNYSNEMEEFGPDDSEDDVESEYNEDEDCDGYPVEVKVMKNGSKKKKAKTTNYGKISSAIGKMQSTGVSITPPDINNSSYTFSPDIEHNAIRYGLSGITRIGEDLIKMIIESRPYSGIEDFLNKVKVNKTQMINLIKSGAFDCFGNRTEIMKKYVELISDCKKRVTMQNMKMLIDFGLIPNEYEFECRVFNFNKYIKKQKLDSVYYGMDNIAFNFYSNNFDVDLLSNADTESGFKIKQVSWDAIYKKYMAQVKPYVQKNAAVLLEQINNRLISDTWNKYCLGSISKWEMDSISCYIHEHELINVDNDRYNLVNYFNLGETPEIERLIFIKGKQIPLFKLERIAGVVLDRDKTKKTVTLLTTSGVVNVKVYGVFAQYDKQISERGADGKKHVIEKSMFSRGNKIIVTGIRQDDTFLAKVYKQTPWHRIEQIIDIEEDGSLIIKAERAGVES